MTTTQVSFDVSAEDEELIDKIVRRIAREADESGIDLPDSILTMMMDLQACHANGCPLRLQEMLDGRSLDLFHDYGGIRKHINRETGKLEGIFWPRYAKE